MLARGVPRVRECSRGLGDRVLDPSPPARRISRLNLGGWRFGALAVQPPLVELLPFRFWARCRRLALRSWARRLRGRLEAGQHLLQPPPGRAAVRAELGGGDLQKSQAPLGYEFAVEIFVLSRLLAADDDQPAARVVGVHDKPILRARACGPEPGKEMATTANFFKHAIA
jgi:hypothetical protein